MKNIFQEREFRSFYDNNSGKTFRDLEFRKCHFVSCAISITRDPRYRSKVKNVQMINCEQHGCALEAAIIEDVLIDGLKTNGLLQSWGAVFKHVVFRGKIGRIMISPLISGVAMGKLSQDNQKAFDEANEGFYFGIDWALDLREAEFEEADLRGVPGNLILRDGYSQFLITREKAKEGKWKDIDLSGTHWRTAIEFFLEGRMQSELFVAPKRHPRFRALLDGLWKLRDAGVVE